MLLDPYQSRSQYVNIEVETEIRRSIADDRSLIRPEPKSSLRPQTLKWICFRGNESHYSLMVNYRCQLSLNDRYYTDNPGRFRLFLYKVLDTVVFIIVDAQAVVASTPRALLQSRLMSLIAFHHICVSSPGGSIVLKLDPSSRLLLPDELRLRSGDRFSPY